MSNDEWTIAYIHAVIRQAWLEVWRLRDKDEYLGDRAADERRDYGIAGMRLIARRLDLKLPAYVRSAADEQAWAQERAQRRAEEDRLREECDRERGRPTVSQDPCGL